MDMEQLGDSSEAAVKVYVEKKFKKFNGAFYPKKLREKKAIEYWLAASETDHGQRAV